jgi:outer membrane receptor protein involved in Fe transport
MNLSTIAPVYFDPEMNAFLSQQITDYAYYGMLNSMAARMGETAAAALIARMGGCQIDMSMQTIPGFFRTPQTNLALFHESHFVLTDRLTATLGLRYDLTRTAIDYWTRGDVVLSEDVMGQHVDAQVASLLQHKDHNIYRQLLPKAGLLYRYDRSGSNVYATVSKGYRAGGFNMQMFSDILQAELQGSAQQARGQMELPHDEIDYANIAHTISYKPETSWNFELGTHANLFDGALQADLGAYYIQVRNQQLSVMAGNYGFGRMMVNAGKSYSCGIEASLRGSAFDDRLSWTASYGYTHAVFKEYTDSVKVGGVNTAVSYRDKRVPFVPVHTFSASADYRFATPQCSALQAVVVGANVQAQGRTYWDEANSYQQHFYATLGMHADAQFRHLTVGFWLRNLDNVHYNTFAVQSAATGQLFTFAQLGNPVQAGVDVRLHF